MAEVPACPRCQERLWFARRREEVESESDLDPKTGLFRPEEQVDGELMVLDFVCRGCGYGAEAGELFDVLESLYYPDGVNTGGTEDEDQEVA